MKRLPLILVLAMTGLGCSSYYHVHDPDSKKDYYTKDVDRKRSGAATFEDAKTGAEITLQSSEVRKISKEEFEKAVGVKK